MSKHATAAYKVRRLFWDIETAPNIVLAFRAGYEVTINHDAIIQERKVICIGYKWEGDAKVAVLRWDKDQNDREMLKEFLEIANEADELVAHYGDRFDLPWFRTRCLLHGLPPLPAYKTIDTKAWASKYFYFNSNKLDYLSDVLGHGKKLKTEFDLWKKILMNNDQEALDYMCKYCGIDVKRLESVYHDLKFCVKPKTHQGVFAGGDKWSCPRCGSTDIHHNKRRVTAEGTVSHQMQCQKDGGYFKISQTAYEQFVEEKSKYKCSKAIRVPQV